MRKSSGSGLEHAKEQARDLTFHPMSRPVRVTGRASRVADFVAGLNATLTSWPIGPAPSGTPFCTVHAGPYGYTVSSDYLDPPLEDLSLASAVCSVIADLSEAYLDAHAGMRALHCGAVQIAGRMVLLAGRGHAGKSTLVARLGMDPDTKVFCDDVLPIQPDGMAFGLGVPPRIRLPLPPNASAAFQQHVNDAGGQRDARCAYVPGPAVQPHGPAGRPDMLLMLRRVSGADPVLHALDAETAAALMLAQDMSMQADGLAHIARVTAMADTTFCATLVYDDLDAAVTLLRQTCHAPDLDAVPRAPPFTDPPPQPRPVLNADMSGQWCRKSGVGVRNRQSAAFLWDPPTGRYFHLNAVALACWMMLETPMSGDALADGLATLFPDAPATQVRTDVAIWLGDMAHNALVDRMGSST